MLARKAAKPAGTTKTKAASRRATGGKKATTVSTQAEAVAAASQAQDDEALDALLTAILDEIDTKLADVTATLNRIEAM